MSRFWILAAATLTAAALVSAAAPGPGPGFDCAKASTRVEKMICGDAELAALDRRMAERYAAALKDSPTRVTIRARQRQFLADRARDGQGGMTGPVNAAALADFYRAQLETLQAEIDMNRRGVTASQPASQLARRCVVVGLVACQVEGSGKVAGSEPFGGLVWQKQRGTGDDDYRRGVIVLTSIGGTLRPLLWNYDGDHHEPPAVIATPDGPLLVLAGWHDGTGVFNADLVFRPLDGGWRDLDVDAWRKTFDARLPPGLGVWKGVAYDWPTLTLKAYLWKDSDSNCCPTGGSAEARLTIKGDDLALKSMSIDRTPPKD